MQKDVAPLVRAAQDGDDAARDELVAGHLPLLYNVVGWALDGHADVDDVVQESLLRALNNLAGLREPASFRSWLVSIAMNQVRTRWASLRRRTPVEPHAMARLAEPAPDFAETAVLRLELAGQRREVAEATRWLDPGERDVLALWWLEASGHLTRRELADGLGVSPAHAAVRVQRMKTQLGTCRAVVRALSDPRCGALVLDRWDGRPSPLWRKRVARHVRGCDACAERGRDLLPPEALLAGLVMVPPPKTLDPELVAATSASAVSGAGRAARWAAGAAALAAAVAAAVWFLYAPPDRTAPAPDAAPPVRRTPAAPSRTPVPETTPAKDRLDRLTSTPSPTMATVEERVVRLVNAERARAGCGPLRASPALREAARRHSSDMAARRVLDHRGAGGAGPGDRITAAGFRWSAYGENIAQGQPSPDRVVASWLGSPGHRANIVNCDYERIGVAVARGPGGPWWTQVFATER
ncbi:sigma-70 family RNA polymerase sigma factor [Actinomadura algeriensis]|uniref:RNA polymerase sigma factor n=1 Tax=Actinomadura algeriensis TaxID=1679523 RepID=A0ABR9JM28_9ACTN|nr:sigma-70 family RNA polymerase sigma factor [Actinomadura algeriensis]MBE1531180.1 RNA polymerase sigma factor (sigma-70 family) [Actinomadura algeriensis]